MPCSLQTGCECSGSREYCVHWYEPEVTQKPLQFIIDDGVGPKYLLNVPMGLAAPAAMRYVQTGNHSLRCEAQNKDGSWSELSRATNVPIEIIVQLTGQYTETEEIKLSAWQRLKAKFR